MKFNIDKRTADPMIFRMLSNYDFSSSQKILYIGVGDGSNILEIERRIRNKKIEKDGGGGGVSKEIVLLDKRVQLKKYFKKKFYHLDLNNENCNRKKLDDTFDLILSIDTFNYINHPLLFFQFIKRNLKKKGVFLFNFIIGAYKLKKDFKFCIKKNNQLFLGSKCNRFFSKYKIKNNEKEADELKYCNFKKIKRIISKSGLKIFDYNINFQNFFYKKKKYLILYYYFLLKH